MRGSQAAILTRSELTWKRNALTHWPTSSTTSIHGPRNCGGIFDFESKRNRLNEVVQLAEDPAIWNDAKRAQDLGRERKQLESVVATLEKLDQGLRDARDLFAMA